MMESARYSQRRLRLLGSMVRGESVLDLGYAQLPNPYLSQFYTVGIDLVEPSPEADCYNETITADITQLVDVVGTRRFDTVICGELIEHVENPYALLRDIRSVLRPSGRLLISTPNPLAVPVVFLELTRSKSRFYTEDHLYYFLPRWVERLITASGFQIIELRSVGIWMFGIPVPVPTPVLSYQIIYVADVPDE